MQRLKIFLFALILGLVTGLVYGWLVSPVEYVDTAPEMLSADYRADIVLMTAEIYSASTNLEPLARSLELLFSQPSAITGAEALAFAQASGYAQADIALLQKLTTALQAWQLGVSP